MTLVVCFIQVELEFVRVCFIRKEGSWTTQKSVLAGTGNGVESILVGREHPYYLCSPKCTCKLYNPMTPPRCSSLPSGALRCSFILTNLSRSDSSLNASNAQSFPKCLLSPAWSNRKSEGENDKIYHMNGIPAFYRSLHDRSNKLQHILYAALVKFE